MLWAPELLLKNCEGGEKGEELAMRTLGGTLVKAFEALLEVSSIGFFVKVLTTMGLLQDRVMQPREGQEEGGMQQGEK